MTGRESSLIDQNMTERAASSTAWGFTVFLTFLYTLSLVDRFIIAFLAPSVRRDLHLSDLQLGLVQGFAFSILYSIAAVPLGTAVDRWRRTRLIAGAVAIWSAMTIACGLSTGFTSLLAARVGVGVGEAALTPASYSIFGDVFPARRLPLAASVYQLAPPTALACAAGLSALMLNAAGATGALVLPLIGPVQGWRVVLIGVGAPGLLMAIWSLAIKDPARRDCQREDEPNEFGRFVRRNWRLHLVFMLAAMFSGLSAYAVSSWGPSISNRVLHWGPDHTAAALGGIALICGFAGNIVGGAFCAWLSSKRVVEQITIAIGCVMLVQVVTSGALFFTQSDKVFVLAVSVTTLSAAVVATAATAALQIITPPGLRGRMTGLALFISIGLGAGAGPFLVGAINTVFWNDKELMSALALVLTLASLSSAVLFMICQPAMKRYLLSSSAGR